MSAQKTAPQAATASQAMAALRRQYGSGQVKLTGTGHALYERHLLFDNVANPTAAGPRQRYERAGEVGPGHPLAAVGPHGADLRAREPQARLLPLDGISDRPLADQQHHESAAQSARERRRQGEVPRLAQPARRGVRRRAWKWRARAPGGVLSRFDGHDAVAGDGFVDTAIGDRQPEATP